MFFTLESSRWYHITEATIETWFSWGHLGSVLSDVFNSVLFKKIITIYKLAICT